MEVVSPSSSENNSYSSFFPRHTTYCIGLKVISLFGNTAKRNAPCKTAENNRRYPLLSAFAVVPSGFVPPKLRKSIYACKWSAVTVFSFLFPQTLSVLFCRFHIQCRSVRTTFYLFFTEPFAIDKFPLSIRGNRDCDIWCAQSNKATYADECQSSFSLVKEPRNFSFSATLSSAAVTIPGRSSIFTAVRPSS